MFGVPDTSKRRCAHLIDHGLCSSDVGGGDGDRHAYAAASTLPLLTLCLYDAYVIQRFEGGRGRGGVNYRGQDEAPRESPMTSGKAFYVHRLNMLWCTPANVCLLALLWCRFSSNVATTKRVTNAPAVQAEMLPSATDARERQAPWTAYSKAD